MFSIRSGNGFWTGQWILELRTPTWSSKVGKGGRSLSERDESVLLRVKTRNGSIEKTYSRRSAVGLEKLPPCGRVELNKECFEARSSAEQNSRR